MQLIQMDPNANARAWANSYIPASINSNLLTNNRTAFDTNITIPPALCTIGAACEIMAKGVFSSTVALGLTITISMSGVDVASATITTVAGLTNMPWEIEATANILSNGTVEVQGYAGFTSGVNIPFIPIKNTNTFTMDTSNGCPVVISAQWGTLSAGGSITLRQMIVQVL